MRKYNKRAVVVWTGTSTWLETWDDQGRVRLCDCGFILHDLAVGFAYEKAIDFHDNAGLHPFSESSYRAKYCVA